MRSSSMTGEEDWREPFVLEALLPVIAIIDFLCDSTSNLECASITHNLGGAAVILDNQSQANCSVGHR